MRLTIRSEICRDTGRFCGCLHQEEVFKSIDLAEVHPGDGESGWSVAYHVSMTFSYGSPQALRIGATIFHTLSIGPISFPDHNFSGSYLAAVQSGSA
jgi:hypothetical protein